MRAARWIAALLSVIAVGCKGESAAPTASSPGPSLPDAISEVAKPTSALELPRVDDAAAVKVVNATDVTVAVWIDEGGGLAAGKLGPGSLENLAAVTRQPVTNEAALEASLGQPT